MSKHTPTIERERMMKDNGTVTYEVIGRRTGPKQVRTERARITPKRVAIAATAWDKKTWDRSSGRRIENTFMASYSYRLLSYQIDGQEEVVVNKE